MLNYFKEHKLLFILSLIYILSVIFIKPYNAINNITFPVNDEWYYALPIINFLDFKKIIIAEGMAAWSIPQILIGYFFSELFGFSFFKLRLIIIFFSILNIFLIYHYLTRYLKFEKLKTIILLSIFIFFPGIYLSGITFMSETIFFTLFILSLIFFENYKLKQSNLNLIILNLVIIFLFLQRQIGVFYVVYLFYIFFFQKKNFIFKKKKILFTAIIQIIIFLFVYIFINHYIGQTNPYSLNFINYKNIFFMIYNIPQIFLYMGFLLTPYLFFVDTKKISFKNNKIFYYFLSILLIFAVIILYYKFDKYMPYFDNVFSKYGTFRLNEALPGERNLFFIKEVYYLFTIICLFSFLNFLFLVSKNKFQTLFKLTYEPLYFISFIILIFSLLMFKNFNDRYIYILVFCILIYQNSFSDFLKSKNKKMLHVFSFLIIFGFFSISVITAKDMFRWNEAGWILTKQSIKKYNFNTFNVMAGHTWNWEKYRHLSKLRKKNGFIKYSEIKKRNDYNHYLMFGKYENSIDTISYQRFNKKLFISLNKQ